jgi:hypothetical protein
MGFVLLGLSMALQGLARMIRIRNARQRGEVAS